ncbi:pyridoxamine 5'-phosphate oxidase family protein [Natronolimnohabitans sp. A-GB9]|uniref:pyridoxamine 5'-phosphate oxidase family protein n=1 Tax=Natronolimnohabitans sp. A-GB9 TaxID=3069757 RepID=UPI0027B127F3|nr:pyridoxamine 5'-phosphate oxidase family protein [Natronolimnohabitans sp. A-GB9]MDQ2052574.1 pyridoxamine 5'-phosphate oxidase family protein [Natronolimnohabitans sp. A-GB9]
MSSEKYGVVMDEDEIADFLEAQGIGTLSMGNETGGYGIPMSFGYDRAGDRCLLNLSFGGDDTKSEYLKEGNQVTLSTYEWHDVDEWRSVVVRGTLEEVSIAENPHVAGIFAAYSKLASRDVFQQPLEELDFEWYELQIEDVHGRQAVE